MSRASANFGCYKDTTSRPCAHFDTRHCLPHTLCQQPWLRGAVHCRDRAAFEQRCRGVPPCEASRPLACCVCAGVVSTQAGVETAARFGHLAMVPGREHSVCACMRYCRGWQLSVRRQRAQIMPYELAPTPSMQAKYCLLHIPEKWCSTDVPHCLHMLLHTSCLQHSPRVWAECPRSSNASTAHVRRQAGNPAHATS